MRRGISQLKHWLKIYSLIIKFDNRCSLLFSQGFLILLIYLANPVRLDEVRQSHGTICISKWFAACKFPSKLSWHCFGLVLHAPIFTSNRFCKWFHWIFLVHPTCFSKCWNVRVAAVIAACWHKALLLQLNYFWAILTKNVVIYLVWEYIHIIV